MGNTQCRLAGMRKQRKLVPFYPPVYNEDERKTASVTSGMKKVVASDKTFVFTGKVRPPYDVTKVVFSSTVTGDGWPPFLCQDCKKLREVVLNEGLRKIDVGAFRNCSALKCITFPSTLVEVGPWAFENCTSLCTLRLNENLRIINHRTFRNCSKLNRIYIPSTSIHKVADNICPHFNKLNEGLWMIGSEAFYGCSSLESIHIPLTVTTVGRCPFGLNEMRVAFISRRLEYITQTCQAHNIKCRIDEIDGVIETRDKDILVRTQWNEGRTEKCIDQIVRVIEYFELNEAMTLFALALWKANVEEKKTFNPEDRAACRSPVPEPVIENVLQYCSMSCRSLGNKLSGIYLYIARDEVPNDVTLSRVVVHPSVTEVPQYAFKWQHYLKEVELNEGLVKIKWSAFTYCTSLERMKFPSTLSEIGSCAFKGCASLKEVLLNEGLREISFEAFRDCSSLTFITFPSTISQVGNAAFYNCSKLKQVVFNEGLLHIGWEAFSGCPMKSFDLPSRLEYIGQCAFEYCTSLERIKFPSTLSKTGQCAFKGCASLKEVLLNEGLLEISYEAFRDCQALRCITFPSTISQVGDAAFCNCSKLKQVVLNEGLQNIGYEAFSGCPMKSFDMSHISRRLEGISQEGQQQVEMMIHGTSRIRRIRGKISISAKGIKSGERWNEHKNTLNQLNDLITHYEAKEAMEIVELALRKAIIKEC